MISFIFVALYFLVFLIAIEVLKRRLYMDPEYSRKFIHVLGGVSIIVLSDSLDKASFLFLSVLFFAFFLFMRKAKTLTSLSMVLRKTYGELTYLAGIFLLAYFLFEKRVLFVAGLLVLIFPDTLAGLIGRRINKVKKTSVGSVAYFLTAFTIMLFFFPVNYSLFGAVFFTFIEYVSPLGFDNLTIPIAYLLFNALLF